MTAGAVVEWAARGQPIPGERESGDLHVVAEFPGGCLLGVIDGLGHGPEAATASRIAAATLAQAPARPVLRQIEACHEALRSTRGAVMSLASIDAVRGAVCWAGVGNVEAVLCRADGAPRERILLRSGVVGYQLPPLRAVDLSIAVGDVLVFASDGLRHDFAEAATAAASPADTAEQLMRAYNRGADDASVLVARYLGPPP